ncbi:unnamed protein product [Brassica napus]|uniref:(rape) hypothetical protein n=1 Tax=Brassica napus TaxID=3708 RepID=A0A816JAJ6_BRANA|nr:unnamed protein product [Brassica napus]
MMISLLLWSKNRLERRMVEICKIICTIEAIDTDWSWFYIGCNRHQKRVNKIPNVDYGRMTKNDKPLFHCEHCRSNINTVGPKFKLHLVVKDDSATCNLMFLGSVSKSIVGVDAEELCDGSYEEVYFDMNLCFAVTSPHNNSLDLTPLYFDFISDFEDPKILPEPILSLVGKSFCFGISITSDNVTNGSDTFVVLEVCSGDKVLTIETDSQSNYDMVTTSSTMSSGSVSIFFILLSCPTPITKRKEDDYDLQDLTSSSKKQCIKIVKQEKTKND